MTSPPPDSTAARAALRTQAGVALGAASLLVVYGWMVRLVAARSVDGREAALLLLPAAAASIVALLGLAAEREGWPRRRVAAAVLAGACLAAQLGVAALLVDSAPPIWSEIGLASVVVNLVGVAVIDLRGRAWGRLLLAVALWIGVWLVLGGAVLVAVYLQDHRLWTIG